VRRARAVRAALFALALSLVLAFTLGPYVWMLLTALRDPADLAARPAALPSTFSIESFRAVFMERPFLRIVGNSLLVALLATALTLAAAIAAAFALARLPVPGKRAVLALLLSVAMLPPVASVGPVYLAAKALGLRDTIASLVIPYASLALPLATWILHGYFRDLPRDLHRAAKVDGCTPVQALVRVLLPPVAPGVVAAAILTFIFSWNEFLFALSLTSTDRARTLPVEIALFAGVHEVPWGEIAAASVVATLPVLAIVALLDRYLVGGLLAGSGKG
jgi:multiple sugar transport system permease protein